MTLTRCANFPDSCLGWRAAVVLSTAQGYLQGNRTKTTLYMRKCAPTKVKRSGREADFLVQILLLIRPAVALLLGEAAADGAELGCRDLDLMRRVGGGGGGRVTAAAAAAVGGCESSGSGGP